MSRRFWVLIHRWVGLAMTIFLVIVGLTGSLLAFNTELESWINPQLYPAPVANQSPLSAAELAVRAEALIPQARVAGVSLGEPGWWWISVEPRINPATGKPYDLAFGQVFLNPYTGEELGRRKWGAISQGWISLMPFIYQLHYSLALSTVGIWALGITALAWTIDCFIGFYLTLPAGQRGNKSGVQETTHRPESRSFWVRWKPAWLIKWSGSNYRINFDLHRAGGLWMWIVLLIFAWSSVYMNLDSIYTWGTRTVFDYKSPSTELVELPKPLEQPALNWYEAQSMAERLMAEQSRKHHFIILKPMSLYLDRVHGVYEYSVRSSLDIGDHNRRGMTKLFFDANSGAFKLLLLPTGQYNGNTVTTWLYMLHMGNVFGMPYRVFVSVLGLAIVMLSVTGVIIWLKKRRARHKLRDQIIRAAGHANV